MWEQQGFKAMFTYHNHSDRSTSKGLGSSSSSSSSSGTSCKGGPMAVGKKTKTTGDKQSERSNGNFVSRLGFKFDVANFDINAVSPTSW